MPGYLKKGFTFIELLVGIAIFAVVLSIVLIATNPVHQYAEDNNTKRAVDVNTILDAIHQYETDNHGALPAGMPAKAAPKATKPATGIEITNQGSAKADICAAISPAYVSALPVDTNIDNGQGKGMAVINCTASYHTGYSVWVDSAGKITVFADDTDTTVAPAIISVTR